MMKRKMLTIAFALLLSMTMAERGRRGASTCKPSSFLTGHSHKCNQKHDSECCRSGVRYPQFKCSPRVRGKTEGTLTLNGFERGEDGGGAAACDGKFHKDSDLAVALSTGWYAGGSRCHKHIKITNPKNGRSARAMVVDECDSFSGCDGDHDFQPPCQNNIVDASPGVWRALGVDHKDAGLMTITWSDA